MKRRLDEDDVPMLTCDIEAPSEADADPLRRRLAFRSQGGELLLDVQTAASFFKISLQRLHQMLSRRDMPEDVRRDLRGRPVINATKVEAWMIEGRGRHGPMPVFVAALVEAGRIERPARRANVARS